MVRRAACLVVMVALGGCKDPILLHDIWDGGASGPDAVGDRSFWWDPDVGCRTTQALHFKPQSAEVLILLDRSSAMQGALPGTSSRAAGVQNVLTKYINTHQNYIMFGFEEFPDTDYQFSICSHASCCAGEAVDPQYNALKHLQHDMGYLVCSDADCLSGSPDSPSHKALAVANDYFQQQPPASKDSEKYVLLITASEPACASDGSANDTCRSATTAATGLVVNQGIPLVILTVGYQPSGSSCLVTLSNLGSKVGIPGAVPRLSSATNLDLLDGTLSNLFDGIGDSLCTFTTNDPVPVDATNLTVFVGYTQVPRVDCTAPDGWCSPSPAQNKITLLGRYCETYLNMPQQNAIYVTYPSCDSTSQP